MGACVPFSGRRENENEHLGATNTPDVILREHSNHFRSSADLLCLVGADHRRGFDVTISIIQVLQDGDRVRASINKFGDPAPRAKKKPAYVTGNGQGKNFMPNMFEDSLLEIDQKLPVHLVLPHTARRMKLRMTRCSPKMDLQPHGGTTQSPILQFPIQALW